jgi:hypothetical protein
VMANPAPPVKNQPVERFDDDPVDYLIFEG